MNDLHVTTQEMNFTNKQEKYYLLLLCQCVKYEKNAAGNKPI